MYYKGKDKSNSQLYKQAGNSIPVTVLEDIFEELFLKEHNEVKVLEQARYWVKDNSCETNKKFKGENEND